MKKQGIEDIDMVVINLYPFVKTVQSGASFRRLHREYRYRRPGDGARGGEKS
jgi:hypothetical protein